MAFSRDEVSLIDWVGGCFGQSFRVWLVAIARWDLAYVDLRFAIENLNFAITQFLDDASSRPRQFLFHRPQLCVQFLDHGLRARFPDQIPRFIWIGR